MKLIEQHLLAPADDLALRVFLSVYGPLLVCLMQHHVPRITWEISFEPCLRLLKEVPATFTLLPNSGSHCQCQQQTPPVRGSCMAWQNMGFTQVSYTNHWMNVRRCSCLFGLLQPSDGTFTHESLWFCTQSTNNPRNWLKWKKWEMMFEGSWIIIKSSHRGLSTSTSSPYLGNSVSLQGLQGEIAFSSNTFPLLFQIKCQVLTEEQADD